MVTPEQVDGIVPGGVAPADPALVGFTVQVRDLDRVADLLTRNHVPFQRVGARLVVGAADACGCSVLFEAPITTQTDRGKENTPGPGAG